MDNLVFLNDEETFSPVTGATVLRGDYSAAFSIEKMMQLLTPTQLLQCRVEPTEKMIDSANEGL